MIIQEWQVAYKKLSEIYSEIVTIHDLAVSAFGTSDSDFEYLKNELLVLRYRMMKEVREKFDVADQEPLFTEVYEHLSNTLRVLDFMIKEARDASNNNN